MATIAVKQEFDNSHEPAPGCSTACSPTDDNVDTRPTVCFIKEETHDEEEVQECLEDPDFSPVKTGMKVWPSNRRQYGPARKATKIKIENLDDGFEGSELATNESSSQNLSKGPQMATVEQELGVGTTIGSGAGTASVKQENNSCQEPTPGCSTAVSTIKNDDHDDDDNVNDDSDQQRTGSLCLELFTDEAQVEQEAAERVEDMELARVNSGMIMWVSNCIQYAPAKAKKMATVAVKEKDSSQEPTPGCSTACSPINDDDDTQRTGLLSLEIFEEEAHDLQEAAGSSEEVECSSAKSEPVMCPPPCSTSHQSNATQVAELDSNKAHSINQPNNAHAKKPMLYRCAHCNFETRQLQYLKNHIAKHPRNKLSSCGLCSYRSTNFSDLKRHLKLHSVKKLTGCSKTAETHLRSHKKQKRKEERFSASTLLKNHLRRHTKEKAFSCKFCTYKCSQKRYLTQHLGVHIKPFSCEFCEYKCARSIALKMHLSKHTGEKPHGCELCDYKSATSTQLKSHLRSHRGKNKNLYTCEFCDIEFIQSRSLKLHLRTHTGKFNCKFCDYSCTSEDLLKDHLKIHKRKSLMCELCGALFENFYGLKVHILRNHSGETPFCCEICDYKCTESKLLKDHHFRKHTEIKPFSCQFCSYKSNVLGNLKRHVMTHTGEKPFSCKLCDAKFIQSTALKAHLRTHTGEKFYNCKLCDYKCSQSNTLKSHLRKHAEKSFNCSFCAFKCSTHKKLEIHLSTHKPKSLYSCQFCDYESTFSSNFKRHQIIHTGEKPFFCELCDFKCNLSSILKGHIRTHTGEKPYSCNLCHQKYSDSRYLKRHLRKHEEKTL
ncbi:oocyte zinc finger protein XlCOF6 isoform X2 [Nilaparvata lugens]|nr:oocyte zinc finger protein XlCOF6 isoform X2 [Nilaparvata lugens]XP_039284546.1 oocyte zinc finger protein XlCOF6 isoform X2 [Nilaparvata lugens]